MDENQKLFDKIFRTVRNTEGSYVPRDYQTVGGFWTTDVWKVGLVTIHLTDEGATRIIIFNNSNEITEDYFGRLTYRNANAIDLKSIARYLNIV